MENNHEFLDYLGTLETTERTDTEQATERTRRAVLSKAGLKRRPAGTKRFGRVLLIAAAVCVCAAVTAAAAGVDVGGLFRGYFEKGTAVSAVGGTESKSPSSLTQSQMGVLDKSGTAVNQSVTDNGTTVTLKAAVCDRSSAYLLLELTAPEGTKLSRNDYNFDDSSLDFTASGTQGYSAGWDVKALKDSNPDDNRKSFMLHYSIAGVDLRGRQVKLSLKNLSTPSTKKMDYDHVIEGTWNFKPFTLQSDAKTKDLTVHKAAHFKPWVNPQAPAAERKKAEKESYQCTVNTVKISSLSLLADFSGKSSGKEGDDPAVPFSIVLHLKNGTQIQVENNGPGIGSGTGTSTSYEFDAPVDVEQISSVTIGDLTVPVS